MYGQDINTSTYKLMDTCADHLHFVGDWTEVRKGPNNNLEAGGGHAHVGAMVYLGDNWPDAYRNTLFTCNLHGNRVNNDVLERKGSGYVARHGKDFLLANDAWFRGLELQYGPDGGVYVTDWSDTGECHDIDEAIKTSGRIYKVTYGQPKPLHINVAKLSDPQLVELQLHKNDWQVRHARRVLQERAAAGKLSPDVRPALEKMLADHPDVTRKLRALWALHCIKAVDDASLARLLDHPSEYLRAWAVRLLVEDRKVAPEALEKFAKLATDDPSPYVRLHLASTLQRLPLDKRWPIAEALAARADDAQDPNLPLMVWYAIEPLVPTNKPRAAAMMAKVKIPVVREHIARRLAAARNK
jgi:hypothetical protein